MKSFLADLAAQIYKDHPTLDETTIVFPNRRAIIYFRKHLGELLNKPAFAPRFLTIEDFIGTFSKWTDRGGVRAGGGVLSLVFCLSHDLGFVQ